LLDFIFVLIVLIAVIDCTITFFRSGLSRDDIYSSDSQKSGAVRKILFRMAIYIFLGAITFFIRVISQGLP
jgi:hypothetical protein